MIVGEQDVHCGSSYTLSQIVSGSGLTESLVVRGPPRNPPSIARTVIARSVTC